MHDTIIYFGGHVKALGNGKVGGHLILFSGPDEPDISPMRDFFTPDTDFGPHTTSLVFYDHGLDPTLKRRVLDRKAQLSKDDVGVWIEAQLALRDQYEQAIYEMAMNGKLGWSSGTAAHLIEREPVANSHKICAWPLGLDASLTPTPAEPRTRAIALKSYKALQTTSLLSAPNLQNLFESEVEAQQQLQVWELWRILTRVLSKIADAAQIGAFTGAPLDIEAVVSATINSFATRLIAIVTEQIRLFATSSNAEFFAVKSAYDALISDLVSRLPLQAHSDTVVSAVEEFSASTQALAHALQSYAKRARDKQKFREESTKAGRMLSQANRDRISAACARIQAAKVAMDEVDSMLTELLQIAAAADDTSDAKSANRQAILGELARFLELEARCGAMSIA